MRCRLEPAVEWLRQIGAPRAEAEGFAGAGRGRR
jgi:hypothetical protein